MLKYAAVVSIYMSFDSEILDATTKIALTKIVARGIARDRVPADIVLHDHPQVWKERDVEGLAPPELLSMQFAAQASGEAMFSPRDADLDLIHEWACITSEEDPVAYGKIPRMNLADLWNTAKAWHVATEDAAVEAELEAIRTAPVRMIHCPIVRNYDDGWRWVHVAGAAALAAEGSVMGHCTGSDFYATLRGKHAILSLRDPEGMPHVTAQLAGDKFVIAQGRSGSEPVRYQSRIDDLTYRCGAMLQTYETVGWADEELAGSVRAAKTVREAAGAKRPEVPCLQDQIAAHLDDPAILEAVKQAVDRGDDTVRLSFGAIVRPVGVLAAYQDLLARRADMPGFVPVRGVGDEGIHGIYSRQGIRGGGIPTWAAHAYDPSALPSEDSAPKP